MSMNEIFAVCVPVFFIISALAIHVFLLHFMAKKLNSLIRIQASRTAATVIAVNSKYSFKKFKERFFKRYHFLLVNDAYLNRILIFSIFCSFVSIDFPILYYMFSYPLIILIIIFTAICSIILCKEMIDVFYVPILSTSIVSLITMHITCKYFFTSLIIIPVIRIVLYVITAHINCIYFYKYLEKKVNVKHAAIISKQTELGK